VLGEFINSVRRDDLVIAAKVFNHFNPDASRYPDLSPAHIVERCEASLKRLRARGKIRRYGVSNHNVEELRAARRFGAYTVNQPPDSLIDPGIESALPPFCQSKKISVMVYSPMHKGLLTGKHTGEAASPPSPPASQSTRICRTRKRRSSCATSKRAARSPKILRPTRRSASRWRPEAWAPSRGGIARLRQAARQGAP